MPRLRFTAGAKADLSAIAAYIAEQSGSRIVAERFTRELRRKCADLRSHPHKSYVIFFRYAGDVLEVVNVIEGHRDIPALFRDEGPD